MKLARVFLIALIIAACAKGHAQMPPPMVAPTLQAVPSYYALIPISTTAAVNTAVTLTIPAPTQPNLFNYICYLSLNISADNTGGTVITNGTTSTTNFNSFAHKFSFVGTANTNYDWHHKFGEPATGCAKSQSPGTATTFVSPSNGGGTRNATSWVAMYYQAP